MRNINASSMWKTTAKVIGDFAPPSLPMDFPWIPRHWVKAVCPPHSYRTASVKPTVLKLTQKQLSLNKCFKYENSLFYGVFPGTKEKAVFYISSPRLCQEHLHRGAVVSHFCWPKDCRPTFALYCTVLGVMQDSKKSYSHCRKIKWSMFPVCKL